MLRTDVRLHGLRFVRTEFVLAALVCIVLSVVVGIGAIVRGSNQVSAVVAVCFFLGVGVNSVAVVRWVDLQDEQTTIETRAALGDLAMFVAYTLIPGALALALRS